MTDHSMQSPDGDAGLLPPDSILRFVPAALQPVVRKIMRFSLVGALSGLLYGAFTMMAVRGLGVDAKLASLLAYAGVVPFNFAAHRQYTFRSEGKAALDLIRYASAHVCNLLICVAVMYLAVDLLRLHYSVGAALGIALVPIFTYVVLDKWVFRRQRLA